MMACSPALIRAERPTTNPHGTMKREERLKELTLSLRHRPNQIRNPAQQSLNPLHREKAQEKTQRKVAMRADIRRLVGRERLVRADRNRRRCCRRMLLTISLCSIRAQSSNF